MKIKGRVWKFGSNIDTDVIIPARYLNVSDPDELSKHCMEDERLQFVKEVQKGDIIVAGTNFGCGSSREHAPLAIKAKGISCVFSDGDQVSVDLSSGELTALGGSKRFFAKPIPDFMREIIQDGGLVEHIMKKGFVQAGS